jgi:hypothetical protein
LDFVVSTVNSQVWRSSKFNAIGSAEGNAAPIDETA